ncbi:hypothetical protein V2A60_004537 [Cordyceps javanica]
MTDNTITYKPSWLASKEFKFLVGAEEKEFTIHSELVAEQSGPLRALVTNGMKESQEGLVKWPHVDPETFARFSEFLYSRDFHTRAFVPIETDPARRRFLERGVNEFWDIDDDDIIRHAWSRFRWRQQYLFHKPPTLYGPDYFIRDKTAVSEGCIAIVKVHILAHYYDMGHLMDFCRAKLHQLMTSNWFISGACDVIRLCVSESGAEGLRELVTEYCALSLSWLLDDGEFQAVVDEYPETATGIIRNLKSFAKLYFKQQRALSETSSSSDS